MEFSPADSFYVASPNLNLSFKSLPEVKYSKNSGPEGTNFHSDSCRNTQLEIFFPG